MWREVLSAVLYGILEGVTEWLPISSTGHLILLDRVLSLSVREEFFSLFEVVIQLGAILAVVVIFWKRLCPFGKEPQERRETLLLWWRVLLATLPSVAVGLLLDQWLEAHLYTPVVVAAALAVYGVAFILIEKRRKRDPLAGENEEITLREAFLIGCFQTLALIPGTSRSGATILGGMLLGVSRVAAAEFSFFLGIPTMLGAGALKCFRFFSLGLVPTRTELAVLVVGTLTAFVTSLAAIRFLLDFVRRHSFVPFGVYRILLSAAVLTAAALDMI